MLSPVRIRGKKLWAGSMNLQASCRDELHYVVKGALISSNLSGSRCFRNPLAVLRKKEDGVVLESTSRVLQDAFRSGHKTLQGGLIALFIFLQV